MKLDEILVEFNDKKFMIHIDCSGMDIQTEEEECGMTLDEMHYLICLAFMYIGAERKGIIISPDQILERAQRMYDAFRDYGMRSIREMSLKEFNEYMRKEHL